MRPLLRSGITGEPDESKRFTSGSVGGERKRSLIRDTPAGPPRRSPTRCRRERSARHRKRRWHARALTRRSARSLSQLAALACRAFVPQAWPLPVIRLHDKEVLPALTQGLIGSPDQAIVWGRSMAPDGDFFLALDTCATC